MKRLRDRNEVAGIPTHVIFKNDLLPQWLFDVENQSKNALKLSADDALVQESERALKLLSHKENLKFFTELSLLFWGVLAVTLAVYGTTPESWAKISGYCLCSVFALYYTVLSLLYFSDITKLCQPSEVTKSLDLLHQTLEESEFNDFVKRILPHKPKGIFLLSVLTREEFVAGCRNYLRELAIQAVKSQVDTLLEAKPDNSLTEKYRQTFWCFATFLPLSKEDYKQDFTDARAIVAKEEVPPPVSV